MTLNDIPLSDEQKYEWESIYASVKEAEEASGTEWGDERLHKAAMEVWLVIYYEDSGKWVRRETLTTTRGFKYPIRPFESYRGSMSSHEGVILDDGGNDMGKRLIGSRLTERNMMKFAAVELDEGEELPSGVIMRVDGILGEVDKRNRNGRIYPADLMRRELESISEAIQGREVFVLSDHPTGDEPFTGSVSKVAGIISDARLGQDDHRVYGTIDVIDNSAGRDVAAIVRADAKIGISQRGIGSVEEKKFVDFEGNEVDADVVQDDYRLESWDIVIGPSADAHVTAFTESEDETMSQLDADAIREKCPDLVDEIRAEVATEVRDEVEKNLAEKTQIDVDEKVARAVEARIAHEKTAAASLVEKYEQKSEAVVVLESQVAALQAEVDKADATMTEAKKVLENVEKATVIRTALRDRLSNNARLYMKVESAVFDASGTPLVDPEALDRIIDDAVTSIATPGPDAPPSGNGVVETSNGEDSSDRLRAINEMRSLAGLPSLEMIPSN